MKKHYLFLLFIVLQNSIFSQIITVKGKIVDSDLQGISHTKVVYSYRFEDYVITNEKGEYLFEIERSKLDSIVFKHYGFDTKTIYVSTKEKNNIKKNTLIINVTLNYHQFNVVEISVKPEEVFGSIEYSVADYEVYKNEKLVLLTYEKNQKKGSVIRLVDENKKELDAFYFKEETIELKRDFTGNIHLITKNNVYWLKISNNTFNVFQEDKPFYFKYVAPIIDTLNDRIYYSNYSDIFPAFNYLEFNKTDSVYKTMIAVIDEPMMEQYRAEFKFVDARTQLWAHRKELDTGIDKEIWVGAASFTNSLYYEPLYAPLFVLNDSVFIFDHYKNKLFKYTPTQGTIDSVSISYHLKSKKSGWEQPLIQDKITGKIYALFMRGGYTYLSLINSNTGKVSKTFKLFYKYVEKIQIINNEVYYIYRPFESIQKKYIYKEKLTLK